FDLAFQAQVVALFGEAATKEMEPLRELRPRVFTKWLTRELVDSRTREVSKTFVIQIIDREREDSVVLRQLAVECQIVERGQQLRLAKIAGASEYHRHARWIRVVFQVGVSDLDSLVRMACHDPLYSSTTP